MRTMAVDRAETICFQVHDCESITAARGVIARTFPEMPEVYRTASVTPSWLDTPPTVMWT